MFLAPGATYPVIPPPFAYPAALGDLLAAVLAMAAIPAVVRGAKGGSALVTHYITFIVLRQYWRGAA